jgi:hypothetical protein
MPIVAGNPFLVNTQVAGIQSDPSVLALRDGRFAVVWTDQNGVGGGDIKFQLFYADGSKQGAEQTVNAGLTGRQLDPTITEVKATTLAAPMLVVAWNNSDAGDLEYRYLSLDGVPLNFLVTVPAGSDAIFDTPNATSQQREPSITMGDDGFFVTSYTDLGGATARDVRAGGVGYFPLQGGNPLAPPVFGPDQFPMNIVHSNTVRPGITGHPEDRTPPT